MAVEALTSVSPTMAWRLCKCPHAVALARQGRGRGGPAGNSGAVALGNAAHAVIAQALEQQAEPSDSWFDQRWTEAIASERLTCVEPDVPERWRRHSLVKRGARRLAQALHGEIASSGATVHVELDLEMAGGRIVGRPDIVLVHQNGKAEILDVKTGAQADEPTEQERWQLAIYAALVTAVLGTEVARVGILRCDGPSSRYAADLAASARAVNRALEAMDQYNAALPTTAHLARPGPACLQCREAARCSEPWTTPAEGFVGVRGEVQAISGEGELAAAHLVDGDRVVTVVGIPPGRVATGTRVRIAHLSAVGPAAYRWRRDITVLADE